MSCYNKSLVYINIGIMFKVFAYDPRDLGSIPDWLKPKTFLKMVYDPSLLHFPFIRIL